MDWSRKETDPNHNPNPNKQLGIHYAVICLMKKRLMVSTEI